MRKWISAAVAAAMVGVLACWRLPAVADPSSSDGLVYVRVVDGTTDVARARLSDGAVRAVTTTPDRGEHWPYWSDGAQRLVFQASVPGGVRHTSDLVLWDPKTEQESMLFETPNREERWPSWSPDGALLAFAFRGGVPRSGVALTKLVSNSAVVIARSGEHDFFLRPSFSPDGRLLVAQRRTPNDRGSRIWILAARVPPRALTEDPAWIDTKAFFTRDGKRIIYTRRPVEARKYDIASIGVDGSGRRTILGGDANEHSARPSPTRDELVFVSDEGGSADLFLADLDGGNRRLLREIRDSNELAPHWSPDGERVVATSVPTDVADFGTMGLDALGKERLLVLDRAGNVLLDTPGVMADWMPPWP